MVSEFCKRFGFWTETDSFTKAEANFDTGFESSLRSSFCTLVGHRFLEYSYNSRMSLDPNTISDPKKTSSSNADPSNHDWIDPATLMRIKNLEVRARVVVEGFYSGLHRSPFHGFSAQFSEYRQYVAGDDPRYIDWKLFARSDKLYIKQFEDETNLRCYLIVDRSKSMTYQGDAVSKSDYATTMAATLAFFLQQQRDATGLLTFDQTIGEYLPARFRPGHFRRLLACLETPCAGKETDLITPIKQIAEVTRKRSLIVLISDLLSDISDLNEALSFLKFAGHDLVVLQTLDKDELTLDFDEPAMFEDLESGKQLYVDPQRAKQSYAERLNAHQQSIKQTCDELGINYSVMSTDRPLEFGLFDFLRARMDLGAAKMVRQNVRGGSR